MINHFCFSFSFLIVFLLYNFCNALIEKIAFNDFLFKCDFMQVLFKIKTE